jgi:sugar lactone lactonase YvrE
MGFDGVVRDLAGKALTPAIDANAVAADGAGNLYVSVYAGVVRKVGAGTVAEGFAHPHALVFHAGALYVADTENRRIRRIDLAAGAVTTFGGDVGLTVALAVGPDGSIYSADVPRGGTGGGVTRTTPDGTTTRILSQPSVNGVAVARDGTVYVNLWEEKRIDRLDAGGRLVPVARG